MSGRLSNKIFRLAKVTNCESYKESLIDFVHSEPEYLKRAKKRAKKHIEFDRIFKFKFSLFMGETIWPAPEIEMTIYQSYKANKKFRGQFIKNLEQGKTEKPLWSYKINQDEKIRMKILRLRHVESNNGIFPLDAEKETTE